MIVQIIFNFFLGFLGGIVYKWSKLLLSITMVVSAILIVITIPFVDESELAESFEIFRFIVGIISAYVGIWTGVKFYESTIEDKERQKR